jgi:hypothetical protein
MDGLTHEVEQRLDVMRSIRLQDLQAVLRVPAVAQTKHRFFFFFARIAMDSDDDDGRARSEGD